MTESTSDEHRPASFGDDELFRLRSRALGDSTRYAIYREVARRDSPVAVAELTEVFGLNHNTVRQHLAKLKAADLVEEVPDAPHGPGRPRIRFRLTPSAATDWNDEGAYERLSLMLLEVATTGTSALEVGRAAGRRIPVDPRTSDPIQAMTAAMAAQGFAPRLVDDGTSSRLVLEHCPFASAAEVSPEVVCALHRGMLEGLAEKLDGGSMPELTAADPRSGDCRLRFDSTVDSE